MFLLATIGSSALYLLFVWLVSAAAAAWLAERKGYGERVGLFFGLILSAVGFLIVLLLPGRPGSRWKVEGPLPNPGARRPLGISTLGPLAAAPEMPDALGPALNAEALLAEPPSEPRSAEEAAREDEPPAGGDEPPAGGDEPPAGGDEPPAGGDEPPA